MEGCRLLEEVRESVGKNEMREWRTRHSRNQLQEKKKKGPIGPEKEKEKEEDKLEFFFCQLYEFHNPVPNAFFFFYINNAYPPLRYDAPMVRRP